MRLLRAALPALLLASTAWGQGPTSTCVEVRGAGEDAEDLRRLVMTELDRHETHRSAEADCSSYVRVERLEVGGVGYLTGRINTQVPHREIIEGGDVARAIERLLRVLLHNDPVRLRGPREEGWLRAGVRALKGGRMLYGVEVYQVGAPLEGSVQTVPGVAFQVRREVARWHVAARVGYAGRFSSAGSDLHLTGHLGAHLQVMWFAAPEADTSFYLGGLVGVEHLRFEGPGLDGPSSASATNVGLGGRLGVELFRVTSSRVDLFAQVVAPVGKSTDDVDGVVDAWVPTGTLGVGVLF